MLLQLFHKRGKRGFTLVELLIVVAIIGVLSTIGVPTYRRMIQKSKKSEAKVNLGGLYTSEAAFNAEYNSFGNNLSKIGFQIDGDPASFFYTVGFMTANCGKAGAIHPTAASTAGKQIQTAFPIYYDTVKIDPLTKKAWDSRVGFMQQVAGCIPGNLPVPFDPNLNQQGLKGDVTIDGRMFQAIASGVISPSADRINPPADAVDVWTINERRILQNFQDGVR